VIGCGRVFERFHLPAIARVSGVSLVAACDTNPHRLAWAKHLADSPTLFGTPEELLGIPGLQAVLVLTPPVSHAQNVIQALKAGVHVLVEKPMALDPVEARQMAGAAERAGRRLQVGFSRRFRKPYQMLRQALQRERRENFRRLRFELAFPSASWKAEGDFLGKDTHGGGVLDDVLSHQADLVCWLMQGRPERARCEVKGPGDRVRAELDIGGLVVECESAHSRYAERLLVELTDGRVLEASGSRLRETGTGLERWRRGRALVLDRMSLVGDRMLKRPNVSLRSFEEQIRDFVAGIYGGRSQGATAREGLQAVEIVRACRTSVLHQGGWQSVSGG
jgi:myo-inositol 2-dehydrogenase/D-chiro-inositol 1-dehydrogenase